MLGCRVRNDIESPLECHQTRYVDDLPVVPLRSGCSRLSSYSTSALQHVSSGVSGDGEDSMEIDLQHVIPVVIWEDFDGMTALYSP